MSCANGHDSVEGHAIPAGAAIHADIHYLLANDPLFVNPEEFDPERYIAEDGKSLRKVKNLLLLFFLDYKNSYTDLCTFQELLDRTLVFSLGKRACAGEGDGLLHLYFKFKLIFVRPVIN